MMNNSAGGERRGGLRARLEEKARLLKRETVTLYFAFRNPGTPWYARIVIFLTVAYALSPVDLIPDFIPVLGYLDDLVIVPLGVLLAIRAIPKPVLAECRALAADRIDDPRFRRAGLIVVISIWVIVAAVAGAIVISLVRH